MIKNVFFDFNGTILDDLDLCIELLNKILKKQNKELVDEVKYKHIFCFPIKEYYRLAGVDFNLNSYEELSIDFINEYQPRSIACPLVNGVKETITLLKAMNISCYILSASEINNLLEQCNLLGISDLFNGIIGLDNIHAASKIECGRNYILNNNINPCETLMIGDTNHDYEVSKALGFKSVLYTGGHQAKDVLAKENALMVDDMLDLVKIVRDINEDSN